MPDARGRRNLVLGSVGGAMEIQWLFLILAVLVLVFGVGVVLLNRRRMGTGAPPAVRPAPPAAEPTADAPDGAVPDGAVVVEEPPVAEPEPARPASLRDRLAKARSAFSGAFGNILGRSAITDESWRTGERTSRRMPSRARPSIRRWQKASACGGATTTSR